MKPSWISKDQKFLQSYHIPYYVDRCIQLYTPKQDCSCFSLCSSAGSTVLCTQQCLVNIIYHISSFRQISNFTEEKGIACILLNGSFNQVDSTLLLKETLEQFGLRTSYSRLVVMADGIITSSLWTQEICLIPFPDGAVIQRITPMILSSSFCESGIVQISLVILQSYEDVRGEKGPKEWS